MLEKIKATNLITQKNRINPNVEKILKKNLSIKQEIFEFTSFLFGTNISIQERIYAISQNMIEQPLCKTCKNPLRFRPDKKQYLMFCSTKCSANDKERKLSSMALMRTNRQEINKKIKKTKELLSTEEKNKSKIKREATIIQKYGTKELLQCKNEQKRKQTNLLKYGVENVSENEDIKLIIKNNHAATNHDDQINDKFWLQHKHNFEKKTLGEIALEKNVSKHLIFTKFKNYNITVHHYFKSTVQQKLEAFLTSINVKFISNDWSVLKCKELDIYIPSHNLAIEVNGVYWHSELNGKDRTFHLNKSIECNNKKVQLLHFWDFEILNNFEIVTSILCSKLKLTSKIFARKCQIKEIPSVEANKFLIKTHLAGGINSKYNIGLFYNNELIGVCCYSNNRFTNDNSVELTRFASKLNTSIVGGFSKINSFFIKKYKPIKLISFSDNRFSIGNLYNKTGFQFVSNTPPNYFYFHNSNSSKLYSRHVFQKHKLSDKLQKFNSNLTEWKNMQYNGYNRIWDCGNKKWELIPTF